jgi:regulator of sigma E protease
MFEILQKAAAFLATLGVLVVFHEWGHYLVARLCGVRVLRFSVGFGRVVWSRRLGAERTEWALSAIPLGGYVKMLDEREASVPEHEAHRAFNRQSVWKRIAIVAAGPVANLLLAVVLFTVLYVAGVDGLRAVVAAPAAGTPAAHAGLQAGDEIVRIDGETVQSWQDLRWRLLRRSGSPQTSLEVRRADGSMYSRALDLESLAPDDWEGPFLAKLGLALEAPPMPAIIGSVMAGMPAERAGLRAGDRVESVDRQPVENWEQLARAIAERPDSALELVVVRGASREVVSVRAESGERDGRRVGRIGISPQVDPEAYAPLRVTTRYGVTEALAHGAERTWDLSIFTVRMLWRMIVGEASLKNISGPLTLADFAGQSAQQGTSVFLGYLALISISLGVLNLLPVPLLDGGHLMYYLAEVLTGRPVSERALEIGQQIGMAVLFALMGLAFYNDLARLF